MVRPNAAWEKKWGKKAQAKRTLLNGSDDILSAARKLAMNANEAYSIILQSLKHSDMPVIRLLDMDDMQMHGNRIVQAYHTWAGNDYKKLINGVKERDSSLQNFINGVPV